MSYSKDFAPQGKPLDLMMWVEQNTLITLNNIPTSVVNGLLKLAKSEDNEEFRVFQNLMMRGLILRHRNQKSPEKKPLFAAALIPFCHEARLKIALASENTGDIPAIPLFTFASCDQKENASLKQALFLHFGIQGNMDFIDLPKGARQ
jgi:hypothetical protein